MLDSVTSLVFVPITKSPSKFYQLVLKMVETHMTHPSTFSQVGLGFSYFALVCISRNDDSSFGLQMHDLSKQLLSQHGDPYTLGRGLAVSALFIAHLCTSLRDQIDVLEEAIDHSLVSGDKHVYLLSVGSIALLRLDVGDSMADIEMFCSVGAEDFADWASGTLLDLVIYTLARAKADGTCRHERWCVLDCNTSSCPFASRKDLYRLSRNGNVR